MMSVSKANEVSVQEIVGRGYEAFWNSKKRYVVCKGSRMSKKSTTAALKIITKMMEYPLANTLVVRKTATTLLDSCYAQLLWAINKLGVKKWWEPKLSPLSIIYKPTGQKILFRGLDDADKVTSVTVEHGILCWGWLEEAYEVEDEDDFKKLDESLRGKMPDGYYIQWLITFNPWNSSSWLKARFFDNPDEDTLALTTTYKCNEFLSDADLNRFRIMKERDPERYKVAGLAEWGNPEGTFFHQWRSNKHIIEPFKIPQGWRRYRTMDWGTAHPYACYWAAVDYDDNIYIYRELYGWGGKANVGTGETAKQVAEKIADIEPKDEDIYTAILDNACWAKPGTTGPGIAEEINRTLYERGHTAFNPSSKGRVEGANQIRQRLVGNELSDGTNKPALFVFANCIHLIRTLPMLGYDKRNPEAYDTDGEDHATDAIAYLCMARPFAPTRPDKRKLLRPDGYIEQRETSAWTT